MKELFQDILNVEGVEGVMLFTPKGEIRFSHMVSSAQPLPTAADWASFISGLADVREADLAYEKMRIYLRRTDEGLLVVLLDFKAPMAMVRLNCDILLPGLKEVSENKGLGRFFKIKI